MKDFIDDLNLKNAKLIFRSYDYLKQEKLKIHNYFKISAIKALKDSAYLSKHSDVINIRVDKILDMSKYMPSLEDKICNSLRILSNNNLDIESCEKENKKSNSNEQNILFLNQLNQTNFEFTQNMLVQENNIEKAKNDYLVNNQVFIYNEEGTLKAYSKYDKINKKIKLFNVINKDDDYNSLISPSIELDEDEEKQKEKDKQIKIKNGNIINKIIIENGKDQSLHFKDDKIFITQSNENSPIFDLAYLYGEGNKKIFVGFQMKHIWL